MGQGSIVGTMNPGRPRRLPLYILGMGILVLFGIGLTPVVIRGGAYIIDGLLQDPLVWESLGFTLWIALSSSLLATLGGTTLALWMWRLPPGPRTLVQSYQIPIMMPHLAVALMASLLLGPGGPLPVPWFNGSLGFDVILAYIWKELPFISLWVLATLMVIPRYRIEAAHMLGASWFRIFWTIIVPEIRATVAAAWVLVFLYTLGAFEIPWVLGRSRPSMISVIIYNDVYFRGQAMEERGWGLLLVLFVFASLTMVLYFSIIGRRTYEGRQL